MRTTLALLLLLLLSTPAVARAGWPSGPLSGAPVCTDAAVQSGPRVAADGAGGAFVAWTDARPAGAVYAQHLAGDATPLWSVDGVRVVTPTVTCLVVSLMPDGAGGILVALRGTDGSLGVQRLDADGQALWGEGGVTLVPALAIPLGACTFASDGAGGVYAGWRTLATPNQPIVQHVSAGGVRQWGANGMPLTAGPWVGSMACVPDGVGGVVFGWVQQPETGSTSKVLAQRLSSAGTPLWGTGRELQSGGYVWANTLALAPAYDGGAVFEWSWTDVSSISWLATQRLGIDGSPQWNSPGPVLTFYQAAGVVDFQPRLVRAVGGGFLAGWRDGGHPDRLYAQRLGEYGSKAWAPLGVRACSGAWGQSYPTYLFPEIPPAVDDGEGGVIFCFQPQTPDVQVVQEVRAARVDASGVRAWDDAGLLVGGLPAGCSSPSYGAVGDGDVIVAYVSSGDIYAQELHRDGTVGDPPLAVGPGAAVPVALAVRPNPVRADARLSFVLASDGAARLTILDAQGRLVRVVLDASLPPGRHEAAWDGRNESGRAVPAGLYFARLRTGTTCAVARLAVVK